MRLSVMSWLVWAFDVYVEAVEGRQVVNQFFYS
jgi:hypothetical protein